MKSIAAIKLFLHKERKQLFGKYNLNLIMLIGVFLIAIISIGFSTASTAYLEKRMSDPFVTCVDVSVRQIYSDGFKALDEFMLNPENQKKFAYRHPETQHFLQYRFYKSDGGRIPLDGLSFTVVSPLDSAIFTPGNVIRNRLEPIEDKTFGIIVSESALKKLGFSDEITVLEQYYSTYFDSIDGAFAVPILAIVRELPYQCDFFATRAYAMHQIFNEGDGFALNDKSYAERLRILVPETDVRVIKSFVSPKIEQEGDEQPYYAPWANNYVVFTYKTAIDNRVPLFDSIFNVIKKQYPQCIRAFDFDNYKITSEDQSTMEPNLYLCYFEANDSLQYKVEAFKTELEKEVNYKLDMSKINNLKNLAHVQQMGKTLSFSIVAISIIFIVVFIYFLLSMHFRKIQRNLGTFKAFGVNNITLISIYLFIMLEMVLIAFIGAFVLSMGIELLVNTYFPNEEVYARLMNFNVRNVILLVLSLFVAIGFTIMVAYRLLRHTPGDLIYNRNQHQ